jgi:two-component system, OmpR family, sensor histidine kinase KdpD
MKNTFLQAVSHDLRTPLAAILGLAVTMGREDVDMDVAEAQEMARRIAVNARKLDRLVNDLLDLDRLSRGIVEPALRNTDLGALVRTLVGESDLIAERRVNLEVQPVTILVDAAKVERIVENLLANAARHTPADAQLWVRVEPMGGGGLIVVEDDGPGVPEDLRESIFEPFMQGPSLAKHSPGVGVGLALVARFAELHGGRAWVQARPGGGSSFRVYLSGAPAADLVDISD